ncbi:hypothetical protein O181_006489 [Austropuccinia psidii MF-1]|uniref:Uncharacterized protein n=1 Tax=Austropuccinia psidii MF-1 TaxID=1389203 RepID=A0A9Q3BK61_9BASI|nr:hypothetical protein [Austropuccinia psidii MF-1]
MSAKIPPTTPIKSSRNVSGLNIDVGNATSQTSSTFSIPNTSITPIPSNPTNKQIHVSEQPGSTPENSSKDNPQCQFPRDFLLNPGLNLVASQEPFRQSKQPILKIQTGSPLHVGHEKWVDGRWKKRPLPMLLLVDFWREIWDCHFIKVMNFYASSPLFHKEKFTGRQHPYASKPRKGHASSSRETILDDEDENMSLTQSETNDEPRGGDFMGHEQGTQSNSEFTHPQMPLTQSMLDQSKMRQQRNQAHKAHNVAKCES